MDVRWLPHPADYLSVWGDMQAFTAARTAHTPDAIWLCEHQPVYTLGQAGRAEHVLASGDIPLVHCDRGGQVTYHGPGQVVAYVLVDLRRAGLFVKEYVRLLEDAALNTLTAFGVTGACRRPGAPGIYVRDDDAAPAPAPLAAGGAGAADAVVPCESLAKIAALGIKVRNGCAYHGLSLNVAMDLSPFLGIDPCGFAGLRTTDMARAGARPCTLPEVGEALACEITRLWDARDSSRLAADSSSSAVPRVPADAAARPLRGTVAACAD